MRGNRVKYVICTGNHKFYSGGKWVKAEHLKVGQPVGHLFYNNPPSLTEFILGCLLGDGSISKPSQGSRRFSFGHSISQSKYFDFKKQFLGNMFYEVKGFRGGFPGSKENRRGYSITTPIITDIIIGCCEENGIKKITDKWTDKITPFSLAIWYMDDGSCQFLEKQRPRCRFNSQGFSIEENELLVRMLRTRFNIESIVRPNYRGGPLIELSADGTAKLFSLIYPYVPHSMKYKLESVYENIPCVVIPLNDMTHTIADSVVVSISDQLPTTYQRMAEYQYDLTIEDNANYFAHHTLLHNSQLAVGWKNDAPYVQGKNSHLVEFDKRKAYHGVWSWIWDNVTKVEFMKGYLVFGEWLRVQHSLPYDSLPDWFAVFDIWDYKNAKFMNWDSVVEFCHERGLTTVPGLFRGKLKKDDLLRLVEGRKSNFSSSDILDRTRFGLEDRHEIQFSVCNGKTTERFSDGRIFMEGCVVRPLQGPKFQTTKKTTYWTNCAKMVAQEFLDGFEENAHWTSTRMKENRLSSWE